MRRRRTDCHACEEQPTGVDYLDVDSSKPELVGGFTKKTFTAMIEGVRELALEAGIIDQPTFDEGIADLYRTAEEDGLFCYTFFKAVAEKT